MWAASFEFIASASVIVFAGIRLARSADTIAEVTGLGRMLVGTVLLAGVTSLPELSVSGAAARQGAADLAVGNLLGSSLFNLLILAVLDLAFRTRGRMLSRASAAHALSGAMGILLTALAGLAIALHGGPRLGPFAAGTLAIGVVWLIGVRIVFYDEQASAGVTGAETAVTPRLPRVRAQRSALLGAAASLAVSAGLIFGAAPFLASSAARIAAGAGLSDSFLGTTLVALATSLPELATTAGALRVGSFDLAIANLFGSNTFNLAVLFPVDLLVGGSLLGQVSAVHVRTCFWVVVATSVAIVGQLYRVESRKLLIEPDALLLILVVLAALASSAASG
jgi:cation:H+ antiporter